jgi:hypothetical protein
MGMSVSLLFFLSIIFTMTDSDKLTSLLLANVDAMLCSNPTMAGHTRLSLRIEVLDIKAFFL